MFSSTAGLGPESDSAGKPSRTCTSKLQTCPLVREGTPQEETRKCLKIISVEGKTNWWRVTDDGLIPGQTGRLTVGLR
jgi:hypothetical protein